VRVDLHDTSGPLVAMAVRNVPQPKQPSAGDDPAVDARIAAIIADNAGPKAHEPIKLSRSGDAPSRGDAISHRTGHRTATGHQTADAPAHTVMLTASP
jgi:hypothetical protein